MAKEKDNEQKPVLNLDDKEYVIEDMTDYQKSILEDINNYQVQINRLDRWKAGQIHVLRESLKKEEVETEA
ncbi:MAG: hypothetical protein Unbinned202contig1002_3 [Prokaryotic dsDNA virus sp.]|mgnify:CR=1 FL=1|nr:MAG: hypothetical protein Unbinned202contig1002_3 [Prokaryotic dsDNA virus sp.]|tara:strand:+ start:622 stop:834 length:213 start_codon:yes stop_codon:yes gene_type:complete